jgi:3-methyl-2-oxobutanoate hydroxymethyltransferase
MSKRVTTLSFRARKKAGEKIAVLTAYDYPTAKLIDASPVDAILVGDSVGMALMGYDDTLSVTMDDMVHHTRMVTHGVERCMVIADMPFLSYQVNAEEALRNAGRLVGQAGAQAVKLEGSAEKFGDAMRVILRAGIPVMGHIGLTPQSVHQFGGYRVQGRDAESRARLKTEALGLQEVGCFSIVLECVPPDLAEEITASLSVPTIGIGAGVHCDGQVLVQHDILGWGDTRFSKTFADVKGAMAGAFESFATEVKEGQFPDTTHSYEIKAREAG